MNTKTRDLMRRLDEGMVYRFFEGGGMDDEMHDLLRRDICQAREDLAPDFYMLTQKGKDLLCAEDKNAEKVAKHAAEKKADRRFQLANSVISAIIGSVVTLLVEHFPEITTFFQHLFAP